MTKDQSIGSPAQSASKEAWSSRGVVKTMIKYALDVLYNPKNSSIVNKTRGIHELTYHTHGM